jgi:hypothetical protein
MFADHFHRMTKLFEAATAEFTASALRQIMNANAITGRDVPDLAANFLDPTRDFVPERYR